MRAFLRYFRKLHFWLLGNLALLAAFLVLRGHRPLMNALAQGFVMPLEQTLGRLWAAVPFSGAELCYALGIVGLLVYLIRSVVLTLRAEYKAETAYRRGLTLLNLALSLLAAFTLLWGVNFYADGFCEKSGLYPQPMTVEELTAVTALFAQRAAEYAPRVPRDESGCFTVSKDAVLDAAPTLYEGLYRDYPFLYLPVDPRPKPVLCSQVMSAMNVTGLYFPFTGESNLNMDIPAATFPATVAHELAHRRGIASEQQCNFLGILACARSSEPVWSYSGWFTGFIHLSNALYAADPEAFNELWANLPPELLADLGQNNAYWDRWTGPVSKASNHAYDAMLKGYGDKLGIRSYGAVVDLLVAYYKPEV